VLRRWPCEKGRTRLPAQGRTKYTDHTIVISVTKISITMNKQGLVEAVHAELGGTKAAAEKVVDMIIDSIVSTLKKGGEVSIAGLGIFSVKPRAARTARNPKTGEAVHVPATKVPKFRAAKALKDAVK